MKKATFIAAASLTAALISGHLFAQDSKGGSNGAASQPLNATASPVTSLAPSAAASTINLRALKDFRSRFAKVADEHWSRTVGGFYVYCTNDGFKTRAYYDSKGHWRGSLKYCDESQLPRFVRDIVKRTYYDLAITFVDIVEIPDHIAYLVHLEDSKTFKIVRVNEDGDMDVMSDFIKSN